MLRRSWFGSSLKGVRYLSKIIREDHVNNQDVDFKKILVNMEMPVTDGYTCLQSECKMCLKKKSGNLYVNKTTGFFTCIKCRSQGEWSALHNLLSLAQAKPGGLSSSEVEDLKSTETGVTRFPEEPAIHDTLRAVHSFSEKEIDRLFLLFDLPRLSTDALHQFGVCVDSSHTFLYFPLQTSLGSRAGYRTFARDTCEEKTVLVNSVSGILKIRPEKYLKRVKHGRHTKSVTSAVLVVNVADAVALATSDIKCHIICLPSGTSTLPIDVLPQLEEYSKVVLWFGDCNGAWDAVRNFSKKLSDKRCYVVKPSKEASCPRTALKVGKDLLPLVAEAKAIAIESVTSFKGIRQEVLAELMNVGKVEGVKWKRFPPLNHILKGFRRGELTVLSGSTGCGKTTFMSEYSLDLAEQGVNTLWGSFEIPNHRLARIMLTQMAGESLQNNMDSFEHYADKLENLPIYFMKLHGQHSSAKVLRILEHAAYVYDLGHVIIDTVQFMMGVAEDTSTLDRFWRQDNIIAGFRSFATTYNCHVTLVIHPRKERPGEDLHLNSVFGGAKATQEADNVFMIQDRRQTDGQMFLKVLKNRYCGHHGRMPLEFNKAGLSFVPKVATVPKDIGLAPASSNLDDKEEVDLMSLYPPRQTHRQW